MSGREELIGALADEMPKYISTAVRFHVAVAHQLEMPVTDVHALGALLETGPIGASELAELMGLTTGAVTRMVDRLTRGGYVRREPDPDDRRRVVLRVEPERIGRIGQYYEAMAVRWLEQIDGYTDAELAFLLEFLRQGRENTRAETVALRAGGRAHGSRRPARRPPQG